MSQNSADARSAKSGRSGASKASISVTLPTANPEALQRKSPVQVRSLSAERHGYQRGYSPGHRSYSPQSSGTIPPQATPTKPYLSEQEIKRILSARCIERAWLAFRDRQMFKLLKHAICAAEHSLSHEILRKVCPKEAELLKDKCMQARVRFRFGGFEFPPMIFFKVYTSVSNGMGVRYVSGKKMIEPASDAARDACDLMGHRKFYDQMIEDIVHHEQHKITSEVDVTTLKDYMQYLSLLDETPAYQGGKDNTWRKLSLEVLPRQTVFYDVVAYLYSRGHHMSDALREELPALLSRPMTEDVQLQHIRIISELRALTTPLPTPKSRLSPVGKSQVSSRRSKQARSRALKMKKLYGLQQQGELQEMIKEATWESGGLGQFVNYPDDGGGLVGEDDAWEQEANELYEWTQELSLDDAIATPRLNTQTSFVH